MPCNKKGHQRKWGRFGWMLFSIFSRKNGASDDDHQQAGLSLERVESDWVGHPPCAKSVSSVKLLPMENKEQKKAKGMSKPMKAPFSGFFHGCSFKSRSNRTDARVAEIVIGRQESISGAPSRMMRVKMAQSLTKMASKQKSTRQEDEHEEFIAMVGESESGGVEELCKKRILMGEKCKPLSGILQYDKDGVLLPDAIP